MAEWPPSPAKPSLRDALLSPFPALRGPDWLEPGLSPTGEQQLREALLATPDRLGVARQAGMVSDEGLRNMAHMVIPGIGKKRSTGEFTPYEIRNAGKEPQEVTLGGVPMSEAANYAMPAGPHVGMVKAYHGSPYDFDRFDMSKIGTGEGAQAYGHGLYFAENPGVADSYKKMLSGGQTLVDGEPVPTSAPAEYKHIAGLLKEGISPDELRRQAELDYRAQADLLSRYDERRHSDYGTPETIAMARDRAARQLEALDALAGKQVTKGSGKMYEVGIDAHPDEFLDWDKPLSEQSPQVRAAFGKVVDRDIDNESGWRKLTGREALGAAVERAGKRGGGEEALRAAGIKGIRYKDAGSRADVTVADLESAQSHVDIEERRVQFGKPGAQKALDVAKQRLADLKARFGKPGTHNYVVFDDKIIDILKKYGLAGLTAGLGGIAALTGNLPREKTQGEQGGQLPVATLGIRG